VLGLVAVQPADAAFNAIPTQWLREDLYHLGVPEDLRFVFPLVKSASAVGLLGGLVGRDLDVSPLPHSSSTSSRPWASTRGLRTGSCAMHLRRQCLHGRSQRYGPSARSRP